MISLVIYFAVKQVSVEPPLLALAVKGSLTVVAYGLLLLAFRFFSASEVRKMRQVAVDRIPFLH